MINMTSGVSAFSGDPFIAMHWGAESGQFTPDQARQHALKILECAEAAESDAAIVSWAETKMGMDKQTAVLILKDLREFRHRGMTIEIVDPS